MSEQNNTAKSEEDPNEIDYAKNQKMSHIYSEGLPCGIIDKKVPGIGATTAELIAPRESIIVVPTKALAYSKMKSDYANDPILYVGGKYRDLKEPTIEEVEGYLNYCSNPDYFLKIIVVADSLHSKLFNWIPQNLLSHFFLMIDEIDTFQYDSTYRNALEKAVDYYYEHPDYNRCMISATPIEFQSEIPDQVIEIPVKNYNKPNLHIWHVQQESVADYLIDLLIQKKEEIAKKEKFLIAYNSVNEPKQILDLLLNSDWFTLREDQVGIMCSDNSKVDAGKYYCELREKGKLPEGKNIIFMSSAYFSGVDIKDEDEFTTIIVSNNHHRHHLLTSRQIIQIAGRNRKGSRENYLIMPEMEVEERSISKLKEDAENEKKNIEQLSQCVKSFFHKSYLLNKNKDGIVKDIAENTGLGKYTRTDKDGNMTYSDFKLDAYIHKSLEENRLYGKGVNLKKHFNESFNVLSYQQKKKYLSYINFNRIANRISLNKLFEIISENRSINELDIEGFDKRAQEFLEKLRYLTKFMNEQDIIDSLKSLFKDHEVNTGKLNKFVKAVHASGSHEERYKIFRDKLKKNFRIGEYYKSEELMNKLMRINEEILENVAPGNRTDKPPIINDNDFFMQKYLNKKETTDSRTRNGIITMVMERLRYFYVLESKKDKNGVRKYVIVDTNPYKIEVYPEFRGLSVYPPKDPEFY